MQTAEYGDSVLKFLFDFGTFLGGRRGLVDCFVMISTVIKGRGSTGVFNFMKQQYAAQEEDFWRILF